MSGKLKVLDLFSAAAGGWSLGMHRAGFETMAACEAIDWRRTLYAQNNPGVKIYDDVRTLTAGHILRDFGRLPDIVVGSPPCQDISPANTKGRGVEGERSGLFFEAVRIIGECRPRWFALENSANLRTRGADAVINALEAIGYTCWPFVVRASDVGANHERPRSWLIGCDLAQVADTDGDGRNARWSGRRFGGDLSLSDDPGDAEEVRRGPGLSGRYSGAVGRAGQPPCGNVADAPQERCVARPGDDEGPNAGNDGGVSCHDNGNGDAADAHEDALRQSELPRGSEQETAIAGQPDRPELARTTPDPDQARQAHGCMEPSIRQAEIADDGCGDGRGADGSGVGQMGLCQDDRERPDRCGPLWSLDDLAGRLRLDDGVPARVAGTRVAVGGPRGTVAASLIVEAYGDAVVPQIPEAIGRAILRVERAMSEVLAA